MEDDDASNSSDDSLALLPDLTTSVQGLNRPDARAARAHSALRRNHPGPGTSASKAPFGISYVNISFPNNSVESDHKNSGKCREIVTVSLVFCNFIALSCAWPSHC